MKQRETTIPLWLLTIVSFCIEHANIELKRFWNELIIIWLSIVLPTGKCVFIFNPLSNPLSLVPENVEHVASWPTRSRLSHSNLGLNRFKVNLPK